MNIDDVLNSHGIGVGSGSNIKSIQKGTATISSASSVDVTVSPIDVSKTILLFTNYSGNMSPDNGLVSGKIVDGQTIRFEKFFYGAPDNVVEWQLIEFSDVKSLQRGSSTMSSMSSTLNVPISPIDISKSIIVASWRAGETYSSMVSRMYSTYKINSATQITFKTYTTAFSLVFEWQVVEFN